MTDAASEVVLVTGASRGLGRATARALGAAGATIIAVGRTVGGLEELDDEIRAAGGPAAVLTPFDLTDGDAIDRLGAALYQRFGRLDGMIHCAAATPPLALIAHLKPKEMARAFELHAVATARLIRSMDPLLAAAPSGRVVFVEDDRAGAPLNGAYGASKAAAAALARTYAAEQSAVAVGFFHPAPMSTALRYKTHPGLTSASLAKPEDEAEKLLACYRRLVA